MENKIPADIAKKYRDRRKNLEDTDGVKLPKVVANNMLLPTDEYDEAKFKEVISNDVGEKEKTYGVGGIPCSSQHHKLILLLLDYIQQKQRLYNRGEIKQEIENKIKVIIGSDEAPNYEQLIINSNDLALDYFNKPKVGGTEVRKVLTWLFDLSNYRILLLKPGVGFGLVTPIFIPYLPLTTGSRPKDFVIYVCPEFAHTDNQFLLIPRKQAEKLQRQSPLYINLLYLLEMNKYRSGGGFRIQKQKLFKQIARYKRYKVKRFIIEDYKNAITELLNDGVITKYEEEIKFKDTYAVFYFSE